MPVFADSQQLYEVLQLLFNKLKEEPGATGSVAAARIAIRLACTQPAAEVLIDGRRAPVQIHYGTTTARPDLDVSLPADALHQILLAELPLGRAVSSGQMKVKGPLWKSFALQEILHRGQAIYPQLYRDLKGRG